MMLVSVDEEVLEGIETERKWRNHINNSTLQVLHKEKQSLQKKLEIAVKALERYANTINWSDCILRIPEFDLEEEVKESCYTNDGYKEAQEALAKIKEIK